MGAQTFRHLMKSRESPRAKPQHRLTVMKSDDDKRLVFGWANIAIRVDGEQIVDYQQDAIDPEELETAAYRYVASSASGSSSA